VLNIAIAVYLGVRLAHHDENGTLASRHALRYGAKDARAQ